MTHLRTPAVVLFSALFGAAWPIDTRRDSPLDRHALVTRHNVVLTAFEGERPLQVGNGHFAFGMDVTGLQTFAPFNTMSDWGWHRAPLPKGEKLSNYREPIVETHGRSIPYPLPDPNHPELSAWMAGNPHRINLGRIGLVLTKRDGSAAVSSDLQKVTQTLDLWSGIVMSRFEIEGEPVTVTTACHPAQDEVAAKVESPLIVAGRLTMFLNGIGDDPRQFANFVGQGSQPDRFEVVAWKNGRADFVRRIDDDTMHIALTWQGDAQLISPQKPLPLTIVKAEYGSEGHWGDATTAVSKAVKDGRLVLHVDNRLVGDPAPKIGKRMRVTYAAGGVRHFVEVSENDDLRIDPSADRRRFVLQPGPKISTFSFTCAFSPKPLARDIPDARTTFAASRRHWPEFWRSGGAIDLSESRDSRWFELERRIVLSQYLMATNEAGSTPPQESGLVNNGWFGRFHMEMVWWHEAHWALWNRWPELNRSLGIYKRLLPQAQSLAKRQGYEGARWPKCIGPDGREWPFSTHAFLVWQHPHPIFFAELDYRAHPTQATLEKWRTIVQSTADFLASYAFKEKGRYVLGAPMQVVSENVDPYAAQNSTFELGYWRFGLRVAQEWRTRLGLSPKAKWDEVAKKLAPLPQQNGLYVLQEGVKDMWTKMNFEHPALTGVFGMLPGDGVDKAVMGRTLDKVSSVWDFDHTWGWDFPMLAMCAARLGRPDQAVDFLLHPSGGFQFDARGLATGGPFPYFPSNGALLYAVAMMAGGWDGSKGSAPGFPSDGRWKVRSEGLAAAP